MNEKERAEIRKLNEESRSLRHDRWIKRQELRVKQKELEVKIITTLITTLIGSAGIFKMIETFTD